MRSRDPLKVLAKLRRIEILEARRVLAERQAALAAAELRRDETAAAPGREAASAEPMQFAAWAPVALAERDRAVAAERHGVGLAKLAREALLVTRLAERQVELILEERQRAAALKQRRRMQMLLDEFAGRR